MLFLHLQILTTQNVFFFSLSSPYVKLFQLNNLEKWCVYCSGMQWLGKKTYLKKGRNYNNRKQQERDSYMVLALNSSSNSAIASIAVIIPFPPMSKWTWLSQALYSLPLCSHSSTALMHNSRTSKDYDWLVATNFHGNLRYWRPAYLCRFCCRLCAAWSSFCGRHECSWVPHCGNWLWWRWGFRPPRWWSVDTLKHQTTGQLSGDSVQTAREGIRYRQLRGYEV